MDSLSIFREIRVKLLFTISVGYHLYIVENFFNQNFFYKSNFLQDRMWVKTRKPTGNECIGSNLNKNWDYKWNSEYFDV